MDYSLHLLKTEHDRPISADADSQFLYTLHSGLLLAFKEQGYLNEIELRAALNALQRRYRPSPQERSGIT